LNLENKYEILHFPVCFGGKQKKMDQKFSKAKN